MLPALGLYALRSLSREGAVDDEMFVRWCCEDAEERKGKVGVEWRRYFSHAWALDLGIRSITKINQLFDSLPIEKK